MDTWAALPIMDSVFRGRDTPLDELAYLVCCTLVSSADALAYIVSWAAAPVLCELPCTVVFEHSLCPGWLVSRPSPAVPFSLGITKAC